MHGFGIILLWFVDKVIVASAVEDRKLIEEDQVEVRPEKISDGVLDINADIHLIRKFFTNDAWMLIKEIVEQKKLKTVYVCKNCYHDLSEAQSVVCEHCLCWYHTNSFMHNFMYVCLTWCNYVNYIH